MASKSKETETPLMKQYYSIKQKHPDAILLFRVGDFYETFGEDAERASKILGIVLTQRKNGAASHIALAGFPHHSIDTYLPKLVRAGYRVAICDQLEDPKLTKKIVKRGITELVTPGVLINDNVLDRNANNFLAVLHTTDSEQFGLSFLDISTGEFLVTQANQTRIEKLLQSFSPKEVLCNRDYLKPLKSFFGSDLNYFALDEWVFEETYAKKLLNAHFNTTSLKGFGVEEYKIGIVAAGVALHYVKETRHDKNSHINKISRIEEDDFVWIDHFTLRNLEVFNTNQPGGKSLLDVIDKTLTPLGARLLKRWLAWPLKDIKNIEKRYDAVSFFIEQETLAEDLRVTLRQIGDLERLTAKLASGKISPRELVVLKETLQHASTIKAKLKSSNQYSILEIAEGIQECELLTSRLSQNLEDNAPNAIGKGKAIKLGVNPNLDDLRLLLTSGKEYLQKILEKELAETGISSLKIGFNNVFGYYLEVTNAHKHKVPERWIRKQTLVNAERYITEELKEYETKILGAEEKILALETEIFNQLVHESLEYVPQIQSTASQVAKLDCLQGFAFIAVNNKYCRPRIDESVILDIKGGRHPVIEKELNHDQHFVPNDLYLDDHSQQIAMITGPNMSGKSAILRQTALIVLMAQIGSYVPAQSVGMGYFDKIFTRVGASDNISQGESTFMVEMTETASILNNLSSRSLILLDEIGRGTSTYDGISIAWAIAEFLHQHPFKPKTLFATHYHELNEMTKSLARIKNFNVAVKEISDKIIFLRKLEQGGSEHSFGIHVAELAGVPKMIVQKAKKVLIELEASNRTEKQKETLTETQNQKGMQLSFFQLDDPLLAQIKEEIEQTDINTLTPVEALMKLHEIKKLISK